MICFVLSWVDSITNLTYIKYTFIEIKIFSSIIY